MLRSARVLHAVGIALALAATGSTSAASEIVREFPFDEVHWAADPIRPGYEIPEMHGARTVGHPGEPLLPVYSVRILLPPGEMLTGIRVLPVSSPLVSHHLPAPAEFEHPLSMEGPFAPAQPKPEIYESAELFPAAAGKLATVQLYRGHRIAYVNLFPLRVRPAAGAVELTQRLKLVITTAPSADALAETQATYRGDDATRAWLAANVANPDVADAYAAALRGAPPAGSPPRSLIDPSETRIHVIVTSQALLPVYESLALDRTRKGLPAAVVVVDDIYANYTGRDPQEQIRNFIIDAYQNWEAEYILFAGDIDVIPDRDCYCYVIDEGTPIETNDLCCELYYGGLDGTWNDDNDDRWGEVEEADLIPEVHVGRVCADNSTEAQQYLNKLLRYEREPVVDEVESASFFGEYLWDQTWGGMYMEEIRLGASTWGYTTAGVPLHWETDTFYEMNGSWSGSDYINKMSGGCHQAHHLGHSNSGYNCKVTTGDIPLFTADGITHTYNVGYSQGCMAGEFDNADCIHEEFIHAVNGYVAWIGNTRYGFGVHYTTNGSSQYYHRQYVDALYAEDINELAAANDDSRVDNVGYIEYESNRWVHYEVTAFGDPAMPVWTAAPRQPELEHAGIFVLGTSDYPVTVRADGQPVAGARVCMWDEASTAYDFGVTDANGQIVLHPAPTYPGTMHLVVSDANLYVTDTTIGIVPDGPYIVIEAHTISDLSGGNGDGDCDAGETIDLTVELYNVWTEPITGVTATLTCGSPHVAITDDTVVYGDLAGGEVKAGQNGDDFEFHIAGTCPDQDALVFELEIRDDGNGVWTGSFAYTADAPVLSVHALDLDDTLGGDGNGCLDPGESATLSVALANAGHQDATTIIADLWSSNPLVTITQAAATAALIPAGGQAVLAPPFELLLDAAAPSPGLLICNLGLAGDWELDATLAVELGIGGFRDEMEAGEGTWTHQVVSSGFVDEWHLSQQRNHTPEGSWSWKFGAVGAGDYANLADGALVTEPIPIAEVTQLTFWHWIDAEVSSAYPGRCYDGGLIEISIDGGTWEQITPEGGYPYTIREGSTPGPFPENTPVFSGAHDWQAESFLLETTGEAVQFRFRFGSDGADTREGWYIDDVEVHSWPNVSALDEDPARARQPARLAASVPNPCATEARIAFSLPERAVVRLGVYDTQGRLVRTLASGPLPAGPHVVQWDGRDALGRTLGSGIYFYRLESGAAAQTRKLTLLR
jgi:hypothetical protein